MKELVEALESYVALLEKRSYETAQFLYSHGQICSKQDFEKGVELRGKISALKSAEALKPSHNTQSTPCYHISECSLIKGDYCHNGKCHHYAA